MSHLLTWDIYEITTEKTEIHGVMLRGRIRKFGLEKSFNVLCENASDKENCVRFATLHKQDIKSLVNYISSNITDATIEMTVCDIKNPVLSKLKVNKEERYIL